MQQNKLYVGNFPYSVDEVQLRSLFSAYGEISDFAMIMDRETGRPKGFCIHYVCLAASGRKGVGAKRP